MTRTHTLTQGGPATARPLRVLRSNTTVWQGVKACVGPAAPPTPPTKQATADDEGEEGNDVPGDDGGLRDKVDLRQGVRVAQQLQLQAAAVRLLALEMYVVVWMSFWPVVSLSIPWGLTHMHATYTYTLKQPRQTLSYNRQQKPFPTLSTQAPAVPLHPPIHNPTNHHHPTIATGTTRASILHQYNSK